MPGHSDHDHRQCQRHAMERAEARCARLGLRLTPQRRRVLEVLSASHIPISAYDIIDRIGASGPRPSPISVYRALEFLIRSQLAHRIESRNAFIACMHSHHEETVPGKNPVLAFLLCEVCGAAAELEPAAITRLLSALAAEEGFRIASSVIEMRGTCAHCQTRKEATSA